MNLNKREKKVVTKNISDILGVIYQEQYIYWGIIKSLDVDYERVKILHEILMRIDLLDDKQLQEKIYGYGSLITDENLLARQVFLCLLGVAEEKTASDNKYITKER